jgi:hypothetical protein
MSQCWLLTLALLTTPLQFYRPTVLWPRNACMREAKAETLRFDAVAICTPTGEIADWCRDE